MMIQKDPRKRPSSEVLDEKHIPELQHSIDFIPDGHEISAHKNRVSLKSNVYLYAGDEKNMSIVNSNMPSSKIQQVTTGDRISFILFTFLHLLLF